MYEWSDQAIIVSVRPYGESAAIVRAFTRTFGLQAGYVHSAQRSGQLRSTIEVGNIVDVVWSSKEEDALGNFKIEIERPIGPHVFEDGMKLQSIQSLCALLDLSLPEREAQEQLYESTYAYCMALEQDHWQAMYVVWEMMMLKALGFGLDLSACVVSGETENLAYISPKSGCAVCEREGQGYKEKLFRIPDFLNGGSDDSAAEIAEGLKITGHFFQKRIFDPIYKKVPEARIRFQQKFEQDVSP